MDLFNNQSPGVPKKNKDGSFKTNPCIPVFGADKDGNRCKNCTHLIVKHYSKKYFKCSLRNNNSSPSTDHRANYEACGKFERKEVNNASN